MIIITTTIWRLDDDYNVILYDGGDRHAGWVGRVLETSKHNNNNMSTFYEKIRIEKTENK